MLRNVAVHDAAALAPAIEDAFPWTGALPSADRIQFVNELTQMLVAAADHQFCESVGQLVHEWRATAEIHADPDHAKSLYGAVAVPEGRFHLPVTSRPP